MPDKMTAAQARDVLMPMLGGWRAMQHLAEVLETAAGAEAALSTLAKQVDAAKAEAAKVDADSKRDIAADRRRAADAKDRADKAEADADARVRDAIAGIDARVADAERAAAERMAAIEAAVKAEAAKLRKAQEEVAEVELRRDAAQAAIDALKGKLGV